MILSLFIVLKKKIYNQPWKPKAQQDKNHVCDQSHHNDHPLDQRLTLVGKTQRNDQRC